MRLYLKYKVQELSLEDNTKVSTRLLFSSVPALRPRLGWENNVTEPFKEKRFWGQTGMIT